MEEVVICGKLAEEMGERKEDDVVVAAGVDQGGDAGRGDTVDDGSEMGVTGDAEGIERLVEQ